RAQIFAWFIEATAAERCDELASVLQAAGIDFPIAPCEKFVAKEKRIGIFVFEHEPCLIGVPFIFRCQDGGAEHVEKTVHFPLYFVPILPDGVVQAGGELDWHLVCSRSNQGLRDLHGSWKCIGRDATGAQFVSE